LIVLSRKLFAHCQSCPLDLFFAATVAVSAIVLATRPVNAQPYGYWFGYDYSYPKKYMRVEPRQWAPGSEKKRKVDTAGSSDRIDTKDRTAKAPTGPLFAIISLSDQHISIYNSTGLVTRSAISTGMPGHRTPTGVFTILQRERWHQSNIYSGAPMPLMQRITWSGVALHAGVVPGYPASHGCIRLPYDFARRLWGLTKTGERVVISPREVKPAEFSHPWLPVLKMHPNPSVVAEDKPPRGTEASVDARQGGAAQVVSASTTLPDGATPTTPILLNPIEYAHALKARATTEAAAAAKAAKQGIAIASANSAEARKAAAVLKAAEAAKIVAEARIAAEVNAIATAKTPEAAQIAETRKAAAEAELRDTMTKFEGAKAVEAVKSAAAFDAVHAWREANAAVRAAEAMAKDASRRLAPLSVLISKRDQRVYVRQKLEPVLDAPASVRNPQIPIGTHVYIATGVQDDGSTLRWSVVSMPVSTDSPESHNTRNAKKLSREEHSSRPKVLILSSSSAEQALDRIEIPENVKQLLSDYLWIGASIIVSDQPLSGETSSSGTDLVVTTRQ
jgi:lipoprotein-anchoring transpeptidase ErfK/SrfK